MHIINVRNVQEALPEAVRYLKQCGVPRDSRYGKVLQAPEAVTTHYERPRERVIFWPVRDANPFFHFMEALWMLGGRNDVEFVARFAKSMRMFSDDGLTFHGAYGKRWRKHGGFKTALFQNPDQLLVIAERLLKDKTNRRQVLAIWDPSCDLWDQEDKKDIPCNLTATFQVNMGALDMHVFNRSNDIIWGCYGANAVHFSMLQEFMAAAIKVPVGVYEQISVNWHGYDETFAPLVDLEHQTQDAYERNYGMSSPPCPYLLGEVEPFPLVNGPINIWQEDLLMFLDEGSKAMGYRDVFFRKVAIPILVTHQRFKDASDSKRIETALVAAQNIKATDWRAAIEQWLMRRKV